MCFLLHGNMEKGARRWKICKSVHKQYHYRYVVLKTMQEILHNKLFPVFSCIHNEKPRTLMYYFSIFQYKENDDFMFRLCSILKTIRIFG